MKTCTPRSGVGPPYTLLVKPSLNGQNFRSLSLSTGLWTRGRDVDHHDLSTSVGRPWTRDHTPAHPGQVVSMSRGTNNPCLTHKDERGLPDPKDPTLRTPKPVLLQLYFGYFTNRACTQEKSRRSRVRRRERTGSVVSHEEYRLVPQTRRGNECLLFVLGQSFS